MISASPISLINSTTHPLRLFQEMFTRGSLRQLWAKLTHQNFSLLDLAETLKGHPVEASHYAGLRSVRIDHIRGTQSRANEFDAEFNPTQECSRNRWTSIAMEKLHGHDLPPVELIQIDDIYYVRDGHHRISVSQAMGQTYIDAEVINMKLRNRI